MSTKTHNHTNNATPIKVTLADCKGCKHRTLEGNGRIPVGCQACGGPYPSCKTSCPIFDD